MLLPSRWKINSLSILIIALAGGAYTSVAVAEQEVERIEVTSERIVTTEQQLPYSFGVVNQTQLQAQNVTHIEETLNQLSGVAIHRGNGQEYLPALRSPILTGAGACGGILTAQDGIPLRASGFCNINELFEAHSEMAQRIEVIKGPASTLYGSNTIHGVINVVTPDTTNGQGLLGADVGSYGYTRWRLRGGSEIKNNGIGINLSVTDDGGYRDRESVDQTKVDLRHHTSINQADVTSSISWVSLDQQTAGYVSGTNAYKDAELAQSTEYSDAFRKGNAMRGWQRWQWQSDYLQSQVTPYFRYQTMDFLQHFLPGAPLEENGQKSLGVQSLWQWDGAENLTLSFGMDVEYTQSYLRQTQQQPTQGSAFLEQTIPVGKHYDYTVNAFVGAPFALVQWNVRQWQISLGARYEYVSYDYGNRMLTGRTRDDGSECGFGGCRYSRPPSMQNSFAQLSPKLGVIYNLSDTAQIFANVSAGYRAPQASELYRLQRQQQVAELDNETVNSIEIGVRLRTQNYRLTASMYDMRKDNVIFRDSDFFNIDNGKTRHQGIEVQLQYEIHPHWTFALAGSRTNHTYDYDEIIEGININGLLIDSAPKLTLNSQLRWHPNNALHVTLEWQHVSDYFTEPTNLKGYPGHDLMHLYATYEMNSDHTVQLRLTNLLDTAYAEHADFTGFSGERYFPGRPRQLMLGYRYHW